MIFRNLLLSNQLSTNTINIQLRHT